MRLGPDVRVHWPVTPNMPARFEDLFAGGHSIDAIPPGAVVYKSWRLAVLPEDEPHLPRGFATVGAGAHPVIRGIGKAWWSLRGRPTDRYRFMLFPKQHSQRSTRADARHIDLEYERIPEAIRRTYAALFRGIAVQPHVAVRADDWARANLDDDVIGVQVRTWRDDPRRERKYHKPAVRRLERLMNDARAARFFVVSDSDEAVAALQAQYGAARILHFPRTTTRRDSWRSPDGVVEDFIDMLLLARTHTLFASYLSTFSEAAWWLGGATARVKVF